MPDPIESIPLREVAELLAAIRDALDVPQARDHDDDREEHFLRQSRMAHVIGATEMLAGGEDSPYIVSATLASVRAAVDHYPVRYAPYVTAPDPAAGALAEQGHQAEVDVAPPLVVASPPASVCSGCGESHSGAPDRCKHCTGCGTDHSPGECGYAPTPPVTVAGLVAAIRDVLTVPQARYADRLHEHQLRETRLDFVIGALSRVANGDTAPATVSATTAAVLNAADYHPVTYTAYIPDPVAGALAEQRHQIEDPAVPPLAARQPSPAAPAREVAAVPLVGEAL